VTTAQDEDARVALQRLLAVTGKSFQQQANLERALESRVKIEQAKGMLAERLRLTINEAFDLLRGASRSNRIRIHDLAGQVLDEPETPAVILAELHKKVTHRS
jgi:AmiR/NasT family two-component response regulator